MPALQQVNRVDSDSDFGDMDLPDEMNYNDGSKPNVMAVTNIPNISDLQSNS